MRQLCTKTLITLAFISMASICHGNNLRSLGDEENDKLFTLEAQVLHNRQLFATVATSSQRKRYPATTSMYIGRPVAFTAAAKSRWAWKENGPQNEPEQTDPAK